MCSAQLKNLGEYHDFYLKTDVLLLGDVFENLRKMCLEIYESDPAKFISAPALAWQMALNKTQFKLYLLTNIDMLLMVEKGIRGWICNAVHHYAKANNKCMEDYDANKKSSHLQYCDVNNLYGWEMSQKLATFNFELSFLILPFLPKRQKFGKVENLVTNLKDECQYVFYIKSLKQALNYGLVLKKLHMAISFNQDEWLKPFIERNNKLRIEAKYDFEKDFSK